jgi:hypothetical protein
LLKLSINSYAAKDTICGVFLDRKDPKLSLSELLSMMTRIQFNPTLSIWPSMWTRLEHAHCLEAINNMWFLGKRESVNGRYFTSFSLNPSKSAFFHTLTLSLLPKNHMLFIASKQCACSRRVHIEGHIDRVGLNW